MTNFQRTASWLEACGKTKTPENLSVQIGCHIEEFAEFLEASGFNDPLTSASVRVIAKDLHSIAASLKSRAVQAHLKNRAGALDALCDSEVTGNGVAYLAGFDKDGADQAVLASNDAKLVDGKPVILPGGKIGKPEGWKAPDLDKFTW